MITVSIILEQGLSEQGDTEYRSAIRGAHEAFGEAWTLWESHWGNSKPESLKTAARLIADMPDDVLSAIYYHNRLRSDHPKVARAK